MPCKRVTIPGKKSSSPSTSSSSNSQSTSSSTSGNLIGGVSNTELAAVGGIGIIGAYILSQKNNQNNG